MSPNIKPEEHRTFFRPHHYYIINLNYIKRYIRGDGGAIELQNGMFVDVKKEKKNSLENTGVKTRIFSTEMPFSCLLTAPVTVYLERMSSFSALISRTFKTQMPA